LRLIHVKGSQITKSIMIEMLRRIIMTNNMTPFDFSTFGLKGMALQKRAMEMAQTNAKLMFDFAGALLACRAPNDVMKVTQDYTEQQMAEFQKQAKELTDLVSNKDAGGVTWPFQS
jgi:hypothetical protein